MASHQELMFISVRCARVYFVVTQWRGLMKIRKKKKDKKNKILLGALKDFFKNPRKNQRSNDIIS
jgi:hypothetical protein